MLRDDVRPTGGREHFTEHDPQSDHDREKAKRITHSLLKGLSDGGQLHAGMEPNGDRRQHQSHEWVQLEAGDQHNQSHNRQRCEKELAHAAAQLNESGRQRRAERSFEQGGEQASPTAGC